MKSDAPKNAQSPLQAGNDRSTRFRRIWSRWVVWIYRRVPPGVRTLVGLLVLIGGVLGFLPIVGFWMIPLGLVIISLDFRPLIRAWRRNGTKRK